MAAAKAIPKPQLRRLLESKMKTAIIGASIASLVTGLIWKYGVMEPRRQKYADFYKTYDPEKRIKLMCEKGLLQSCGQKNK